MNDTIYPKYLAFKRLDKGRSWKDQGELGVGVLAKAHFISLWGQLFKHQLQSRCFHGRERTHNGL